MTAEEAAAVIVADRPVEAYPRYRWVIASQLWLQQMINFLIGAAVGVVLPSMRAELIFGPLEAGLLGATRPVGMIASLLASPVLARFDAKRVLAALIALTAAFIFAQSLASSYVLLLIWFTAYGTCIALSMIPTALVRLQWIPQKEFATVLGVGMGLSALTQTLVFMLIPLLLAGVTTWRGAFQGAGVLVAVLFFLWLVLGKERLTEHYQEGLVSSQGMRALGRALRRKEFILLGLALMGGSTAYMTALLFLPTYLVEERQFSLAAAGLITGLMPLGGMVASFSVGFISDWLGRRKPTIWPVGLILPILYLILLSPAPQEVMAPVAFLLGYAAFAPFPALQTIPYELPGIGPSEVAIGQSFMLSVSTLGNGTGPVLAGAVAQALGSIQLGILSVCFLPLILVVVGLIIPETGPGRRRKEVASLEE